MKYPPPLPLFDNIAHLVANEDIPPYAGELHSEDYEHARAFLLAYRGSEDTFNAYRREVERLLQWTQHITPLQLKEIQRQHIELFIDFCLKPPLTWTGMNHVPRFQDKGGVRTPNIKWRPFILPVSKRDFREGKPPEKKSYKMSSTSVKHLLTILSTFFNYLVDEDYILSNPVKKIRQKKRYIQSEQKITPIRRLTAMQWKTLHQTAEEMAKEQPEIHERTLFIINALYYMYLRISELVAGHQWIYERGELSKEFRWIPTMGDFYKDGDGNWWFKTVGKGNKARSIAVSNTMLKALKRYRKFLKLSDLPTPREQVPLLTKGKGKEPIQSVRTIRKIVQICIDRTIKNLIDLNQAEEADSLMASTVHWFRHTGISDDIKERPREHVRDDAGHYSSATTDKYINVELRERHESAKHKHERKNDKKRGNYS